MADRDALPGILTGSRERFDASTDFTVGIEEEYQLLDPATLALTNRFEDVMAAAPEPLRERLAGELIASEVEFRTGRHTTFADAARELTEGRLATLALADALGLALGVSGVHPFSPWSEQRIIDTPHYRRVEEELGYIAWTNNTWSLHLHVGVRGADRAVAVSTAMRSVLPELLALSANSAVFGGPRHAAALDPHPGLHQELPALRPAGRVRRLGRVRPTSSICSSAPGRSSRARRSGGACGRTTASARSRFGSATARPRCRTRSASRPSRSRASRPSPPTTTPGARCRSTRAG